MKVSPLSNNAQPGKTVFRLKFSNQFGFTLVNIWLYSPYFHQVCPSTIHNILATNFVLLECKRCLGRYNKSTSKIWTGRLNSINMLIQSAKGCKANTQKDESQEKAAYFLYIDQRIMSGRGELKGIKPLPHQD